MASNNLWTIIRGIQHGGEITPRQGRQLLGAVKNIGQRHPAYAIQPGGEGRIKPIPVAGQQPSITDVCRQSPAMKLVLAFYGRASA